MLNFRIVLCGATIGLTACGNLLVNDVTDPDRNRVLGTPADVESFIGATYAQIQNATLGGSNDDIQTQMQVMGMENVSGLANFAMGPRGGVPRNPIDNTRGSQGNAGTVRHGWRQSASPGSRPASIRYRSARRRATPARSPLPASPKVSRWAISLWC